MTPYQLEKILNEKLQPERIKDYAPNGLQVEGAHEIKTIVTAVSASYAVIEAAIEKNAQAILVHHGYFWSNEPSVLTGMKGRRIRALMKNDINLFGYHLPLDIHPELGNNVQLARLLEINVEGYLEGHPQSVGLYGSLKTPLSAEALSQCLTNQLARAPLHIAPEIDKPIKTIGWVTGGGQDYLHQAAALGLDAFISGEISERTTYIAREENIHYFAAGHHATERYGIKALGEWLSAEHGMDVIFVDIDNPV